VAETFYIKQHDLEPSLEVQLLSGTDPVDLSQAAAVALFVYSRRTGLKVSGSMTIADQTVTANLGVVTYAWRSGDTDTVGVFNAEIQVTWPGDKPQTFPAHQYFTVDVQKDLGP
jgi:hypothetical protein